MRGITFVLLLIAPPLLVAQEVYRYSLEDLFPPLSGQALHVEPLENGFLLDTSQGILVLDSEFRLDHRSWDFWALGPQESVEDYYLWNSPKARKLYLQKNGVWTGASSTAQDWNPETQHHTPGIPLGGHLFTWQEAPFPRLPQWQWAGMQEEFPFFPDKILPLMAEEKILATSLFGEQKLWSFYQGSWTPLKEESFGQEIQSFLQALALGRPDPLWGLPQAKVRFQSSNRILYADYASGEIVSNAPLEPMTFSQVRDSYQNNQAQWEANSSLGALEAGLLFWQAYWNEEKSRNPFDERTLQSLAAVQNRLEEVQKALRGTGSVQWIWQNDALEIHFFPDGLKQSLSSVTLHILFEEGWEKRALSAKNRQKVPLAQKPLLINALLVDSDNQQTWTSFIPPSVP